MTIRGDVLPAASADDLLAELPVDYGLDASAALQTLRADER